MTQEHIPGPQALKEIWIGYSERRFKPIPFMDAASAHEWARSLNPHNFGKVSVKHYRQVVDTPPDPEYIPSKPGVEAYGDSTPPAHDLVYRVRELEAALRYSARMLDPAEHDVAYVLRTLQGGPVTPAAPLDAQDGLDLAAVEAALAKVTQVPRDYWPEDREVAIGVLAETVHPLISRLSSLRESVASLTRERGAAVKALAGSVIETKVAEMERDAARKALARLDSACQDLGAVALPKWEYRAPAYLEKQWDAVAEALEESCAILTPTSPKEAQ